VSGRLVLMPPADGRMHRSHVHRRATPARVAGKE
jgi:hypothetical protein